MALTALNASNGVPVSWLLAIAPDREIGPRAGHDDDVGTVRRGLERQAKLPGHLRRKGIAGVRTVDHKPPNAIGDIELDHAVSFLDRAANVLRHVALENLASRVLGVLDMCLCGLAGGPAIALGNGEKDRAHFLGAELGPPGARHRLRAQKVDPCDQPLQQFLDEPVAGTAQHRAIEIGGCGKPARRVAGLNRAFECLQRGPHGLPIGLRRAARAQGGGLALEQGPDTIDLFGLCPGQDRNLRAAIGHDDDQTLGRKTAQRLAQRRAADPQAPAEIRLDQPIAGAEHTRQDCGTQFFRGLLMHRLDRDAQFHDRSLPSLQSNLVD